jgi:uroporphyrinogen-III decarboxylase
MRNTATSALGANLRSVPVALKSVLMFDSFDMDTFGSPGLVLSGRVLEMLDYRMYNWPRHGLPADTPSLQYIENEYMKADEYDKLLKDPSDFLLRSFLPRSFGTFAPFQKLLSLTSIVELPQGYLMPFASPDVQKALRALIDAGKELADKQKVVDECQQAGLEAGFPPLTGGSYPVKAPFDTLGDTLRGTKGILMDMYRQPDKIHEAMDRIADLTISEVAASDAEGSPLIMIPLHKGDDTFMSGKQFETFYWPSLKKVILGLVNEGFVPMLFAEGSYNKRLDIIGELPRGSVVWYFDRTDIVKAKEVIGDVVCIAGNVPSSLLITGTPRAVKEHCRQLIETVGRNGGYILASGAGLSEVSADNLRAMMAAAKEFGVYS